MMKEFLRGSTFDLSGVVTALDTGVAMADLTGWLVQSQIRTKAGVLVEELIAEWLNPAQRLVRVRATSTADWPLGAVGMDLMFTSPSGVIVHTRASVFEIVETVTRYEP